MATGLSLPEAVKTEVLPGHSLTVQINNAAALQKKLPPGTSFASDTSADDEGNLWSLHFFPNGHTTSRESFVAVMVRLESAAAGVSAVKIKVEVEIIHKNGQVVMHKALDMGGAFVSCLESLPVERELGFADFAERTVLPPSFTVKCRLTIKEQAREKLMIEVPDLKDVRANCCMGKATTGPVYMHTDGSTWLLYLYPMGNVSAREGYVSVYAKVLSLPDRVHTVSFDGSLDLLGLPHPSTPDVKHSVPVLRKAIPISPPLSPIDRVHADTTTWGFPSLVEYSTLPAAFRIEATIATRDMLRCDQLRWYTSCFATLRQEVSRGTSCISHRYLDPHGGQWCLQVYPRGTKESAEDHIGVFVKLMDLPKEIVAVKFQAHVHIHTDQPEYTTLKRRQFAVSNWLSPNGRQPASLADWGNRDFCGMSCLTSSTFMIDCDLDIKDMIRNDRPFFTVASLEVLRREVPRPQYRQSWLFVGMYDLQWTLVVYPNGHQDAKDGTVSVFLQPAALPPGIVGVSFTASFVVATTTIQIMVKEMHMSNAFSFLGVDPLLPKAARVSTGAMGYKSFAEAKKLPSGEFRIMADVNVHGLLRDDTLVLDMTHFSEHCLMPDGCHGQPIRSTMAYVDRKTEATFILNMYPLGKTMDGRPEVWIRVVRRPEEASLYLKAALLTVQYKGQSVRVPHPKILTWEDHPDPVEQNDVDAWGWHAAFDHAHKLPDAFRVEVTLETSTTRISPLAATAQTEGGADETAAAAAPVHRATKKKKRKNRKKTGKVTKAEVRPHPDMTGEGKPGESGGDDTEQPPETSNGGVSPSLDMEGDMLRSFECPISYAIMKDPVMAMDFHTYEREAIEAWIAKAHSEGRQLSSPMTNLPMTDMLMPNTTLRKSIDDFREMTRVGKLKATTVFPPQQGGDGAAAAMVASSRGYHQLQVPGVIVGVNTTETTPAALCT
jgi:hypothetical protein